MHILQVEGTVNHFLDIALPVILTVIGAQWFAHRASQADARKRDQKMGWILTEHPPHSHGENEGPLHAENIRFPKVQVNGK